jgi:hypothetical protein
MRLSSRHVFAHLPLGCSRAWAETASSNPLFQKAGQGSGIQSKPEPGRWPYRQASGARISLDESRWQGIREYTATVSPMAHDPLLIRQRGHRQSRAMGNPPDERRPEDCYPGRSRTPPFITQLKDLVPGCPCNVRLQPSSFERSLPKPKLVTALPFGNSTTEALFHDSLDCCMPLLGQLPHFVVKVVWYLYCCLHMANHIIGYGMVSSSLLAEPFCKGTTRGAGGAGNDNAEQ